MPDNKIAIIHLINVAVENLGAIANEMMFVGGVTFHANLV